VGHYKGASHKLIQGRGITCCTRPLHVFNNVQKRHVHTLPLIGSKNSLPQTPRQPAEPTRSWLNQARLKRPLNKSRSIRLQAHRHLMDNATVQDVARQHERWNTGLTAQLALYTHTHPFNGPFSGTTRGEPVPGR